MEISIKQLKEIIATMPDTAVCMITSRDHEYLPAEISLEKASVNINSDGSKSYCEHADGYDEFDMLMPVLVFR